MGRIEEQEITRMDLDGLQLEYAQALSELRSSLLNGTPWEQVQEHRFQVTTLSIALHRRLQSGSLDPAQHRNRG
ncbi:hypothetical protein [Flaviaesturariibacter amylovorans]|uniref:Uncharacterized protein n=1 Tax=Flaviaesturariibacter amylovorans TaxID=1084520 RepID=A0ABP8H7T8_9BACT